MVRGPPCQEHELCLLGNSPNWCHLLPVHPATHVLSSIVRGSYSNMELVIFSSVKSPVPQLSSEPPWSWALPVPRAWPPWSQALPAPCSPLQPHLPPTPPSTWALAAAHDFSFPTRLDCATTIPSAPAPASQETLLHLSGPSRCTSGAPLLELPFSTPLPPWSHSESCLWMPLRPTASQPRASTVSRGRCPSSNLVQPLLSAHTWPDTPYMLYMY